MEKSKMVLGQDHPDTLTAMNNLAFTYKTQARNEEAIALMKSTLALRCHKLGENHPATKSSRDTFAEWTKELDKKSLT
jgi:hypothetical protein